MRMNGADALLRSLEAEGVETVFGIPGGAILPTYDALARGTTIRHVLARHEQGAGHMAEGYARASGRVGVAFATSGPGATNLVTPIADAWMDSTPLVCVTGQVRSHLIGTDAFQECDITGDHDPDRQALVARPGRRGAAARDQGGVPRRPARAAAARSSSTSRATSRRPRSTSSYPDEIDLPGWRPAASVNAKQVRAAAHAIADGAAARPLRRRRDDQRRRLRRAPPSSPSCWQLPVVTTLMAKSAFPETHELHFGWPGMHGAKWSNWAMNKCDVLVAVGARFDDRVTGKLAAFAPGATVVHLDIDAAEIGKLRHADVPVVGPLKQILAELAARVRGAARDGRPLPDGAVAARSSPTGARSSRSATARRRPAQAAERARDAAGADERPRRRDLDDRRRPAPDVGDAVPALRPAAQLHHLGRPRHDGLRGPGRGRREGGPPGRDRRLRRRRRLLPDDVAGARDVRARGSADRRRDRQQRLPRDGPAVAGHVLRGAVLAGAPRRTARPTTSKLAEAYGAVGLRVDDEDELDAALAEALACGRTAVVDCRVDAGRALLPDDPGRRGRARPRRVRASQQAVPVP